MRMCFPSVALGERVGAKANKWEAGYIALQLLDGVAADALVLVFADNWRRIMRVGHMRTSDRLVRSRSERLRDKGRGGDEAKGHRSASQQVVAPFSNGWNSCSCSCHGRGAGEGVVPRAHTNKSLREAS